MSKLLKNAKTLKIPKKNLKKSLFFQENLKIMIFLFSQFCQLRRLIFNQSSPNCTCRSPQALGSSPGTPPPPTVPAGLPGTWKVLQVHHLPQLYVQVSLGQGKASRYTNSTNCTCRSPQVLRSSPGTTISPTVPEGLPRFLGSSPGTPPPPTVPAGRHSRFFCAVNTLVFHIWRKKKYKNINKNNVLCLNVKKSVKEVQTHNFFSRF